MVNMQEVWFLLSVKELSEGPEAARLMELACKKLDRERLLKVQKLKNTKKQAQSIGAGLLLQLGLQYGLEGVFSLEERCQQVIGRDQKSRIYCMGISQLTELLGLPVEEKLVYGERGKPFLEEDPFLKAPSFFFSLSHSEEYVFGAFSHQEIGADIQFCKPDAAEREESILKRFFSETECKVWANLVDREEKRSFFYLLWTRKEAYGKLTGEGILASAGCKVYASAETVPDRKKEGDAPKRQTDVSQEKRSRGNKRNAFWEDYEFCEEGGKRYQISVCKYR